MSPNMSGGTGRIKSAQAALSLPPELEEEEEVLESLDLLSFELDSVLLSLFLDSVPLSVFFASLPPSLFLDSLPLSPEISGLALP